MTAPTDSPTYYHRTLTVGDPDNPVGICTLWTPQEKISRRLLPEEYGRIGNLYSRDGINHIVRNVFAEPVVRQIIICGVDLTGSGEAFLRLASNGIDDDYRIVGDVGLIDRDLPRWAIDEFRRSVQLIDLRGTTDPDELRKVLSELPRLPPFGEPRYFPRSEPQAVTFPSEGIGQLARGRSVAETWLRALAVTLRFGEIESGPYQDRRKCLRELMLVVGEEDPKSLEIPDWLPVTSEYLAEISFPLLLDRTPPAGLVDTEGQRLFDYAGLDQVERIAETLRENSASEHAVAMLWNPATDHSRPTAPNLLSLRASVVETRLYLSANLRSVDLYRSWPETAFALRLLQSRIAIASGIGLLGPLTTLLGSAYIQDDAWDLARDVVDQNRRRVVRRPRKQDRDRRGSFVIRLEGDEIRVDHYSPAGVKLQEFHGQTAAELALQIQPFISQMDHALHIGGELQKAEIARTRSDIEFLQDHPLRFNTVSTSR